ncbi:MAG: hypothetical protein ABJZ55_25005 [Fuerstiella sp.]
MAQIDVYKEWLGIPEGDRPPDYYTLLRLVQFEDDVDKINANYRKLNGHVRKYATGQYLKESQSLLNELAKAMLCLTDSVSKEEYDISQGREVQSATGSDEVTTLSVLVLNGDLERSQVAEVEHFADARGLSHRDALVQMKLVKPTLATRAMAQEFRLPFVDLDDMLPEDDVLDKLPRNVVKRHTCLPLFEERGRLMVACVDRPSPELEDEIRLRYGMPIRAVIAMPRSIQKAHSKYYAAGMRNEGATEVEAGGNQGKSKPKPGKPVAKKKPAGGKLSDEEKKQRMQYSLIAICWSVMIPSLVASQVLGLGTTAVVGIGLGIGAVVGVGLKLTYWK